MTAFLFLAIRISDVGCSKMVHAREPHLPICQFVINRVTSDCKTSTMGCHGPTHKQPTADSFLYRSVHLKMMLEYSSCAVANFCQDRRQADHHIHRRHLHRLHNQMMSYTPLLLPIRLRRALHHPKRLIEHAFGLLPRESEWNVWVNES